jgi:hypothetical protein
MANLILIPAGHMRFVPAHRQTDDMTATLSPTKWPMEIVLISNAVGRERYLDQSWIHGILAPTIQAVCHMTTTQAKFFPLPDTTSTGAFPRPGRHPMHPIPRCPATLPTIGTLTPNTPPWGHYAGTLSNYVPNLGHVRSHRVPAPHSRSWNSAGAKRPASRPSSERDARSTLTSW